jgi:hypothetical protein
MFTVQAGRRTPGTRKMMIAVQPSFASQRTNPHTTF